MSLFNSDFYINFTQGKRTTYRKDIHFVSSLLVSDINSSRSSYSADITCDLRYCFRVDSEIDTESAIHLIKNSVNSMEIFILGQSVVYEDDRNEFCVEAHKHKGLYFLSSRKISVQIPVRKLLYSVIKHMIDFSEEYHNNDKIKCISSITTDIIYVDKYLDPIKNNEIFFNRTGTTKEESGYMCQTYDGMNKLLHL
jgi:DNA-binding transcriptional regulator WhiA